MVPGMSTGLDRLASGDHEALAGLKVALLCNHTAVTSTGRHAVEVLREIPGLEIVRLLGPEHGVWSTHQDMEAVDTEGTDAVFGLPEVSLYGHNRDSLAPDSSALEGIDAVVYDIQDIGTRFYTYAATLAFVMEVAERRAIPVIVLDRPNPIGRSVEGPLLRAGFESFCGIEPGLPVRHGLTVGELGRWYGERRAPGCDLRIVTGVSDRAAPWVPPSPNMPTVETAIVYPGMCLLEGTDLSEGRGTTTPFLIFGAPGIDAQALVDDLRAREIPGLNFVPRVFRPEFQKHAGAICGGAYMEIVDSSAFRALDLGVHIIDACHRVAPHAFNWRLDAYEFVTDVPAIDLLWGSTELRETIDSRGDVGPLLERAAREAASFRP